MSVRLQQAVPPQSFHINVCNKTPQLLLAKVIRTVGAPLLQAAPDIAGRRADANLTAPRPTGLDRQEVRPPPGGAMAAVSQAGKSAVPVVSFSFNHFRKEEA